MMSRITLSLRKRAHSGHINGPEDLAPLDAELSLAAQQASVAPTAVTGAGEVFMQPPARPSTSHSKPSEGSINLIYLCIAKFIRSNLSRVSTRRVRNAQSPNPSANDASNPVRGRGPLVMLCRDLKGEC